MTTKCTTEQLAFQGLGRREVVGRFDGGEISSDGGGLLLREVEQRTQILRRLSQCFTDRRDPARIEHALESLVKQRVLGIALGYEDLNDHDELCRDSVLALLSECSDMTGLGRVRLSDRGKPLAGKSTLNRLELTPEERRRLTSVTSRRWRILWRWMRCWSRCFWSRMRQRLRRLSWMWMPPMTRYTVIRQGAFFTAITGIIVICRCIFSVASSCCAPACGRRTRTGRRARPRNWHV